MLVIGRNEGEAFTLILPNGDRVRVTLNKYEGQNTKIGIDAPEDVVILRDELLSD